MNDPVEQNAWRLLEILHDGKTYTTTELQKMSNINDLREVNNAISWLTSKKAVSIEPLGSFEQNGTIRLFNVTTTFPGITMYQNYKSQEDEVRIETGTIREELMNSADTRNVFVVYGRNVQMRDALFTFLHSINLHPIEWSEAVQATGVASPYVGQILDAGFAMAQAVVVLLTPDDEARLLEQYREAHDPPHEIELTPQARPNVLFEAGMAMGKHPDRTIIIEIGTLRPFSDVAGRHTLRMNDSPEQRQNLAQRLLTAGCDVRTTGTAWYKAGKFTITANPT